MDRTKYPRTWHLPWSLGVEDDDEVHPEVGSLFGGLEVVVSEKLDGQNATVYPDGYTHARSLDSRALSAERAWMRAQAAQFGSLGLPETMRVAGENLYARHSIAYHALPAYFIGFAVFDGDWCLSWDETVEWLRLVDVVHVPVLYRGPWDEKLVRACWTGRSTASPGDEQEGYVVRVASRFPASEFTTHTAKFVRADHNRLAGRDRHGPVIPNGLAAG